MHFLSKSQSFFQKLNFLMSQISKVFNIQACNPHPHTSAKALKAGAKRSEPTCHYLSSGWFWVLTKRPGRRKTEPHDQCKNFG